MYICFLCNTGSMHEKQLGSHLRGSAHRQALTNEQVKERLHRRTENANVLMKRLTASIEQLTLPKWRNHVKAELCDYVFCDQSDTVQPVPDSIDKLLKKYIKLEKISLLELAVWKYSCLWFDGSINFQTMQDILDQWAVDENFDPSKYKAERRFTSSVPVIMKGVLQFLDEQDLEIVPDRSLWFLL